MAGKNTTITLNNEKDTIPRASTGTGTVTKNGDRLIGSGTSFTSELSENDWVYIVAIDEVQKIRNIVSDTELTLETGFTGAVSSSAFKYVQLPRYQMVSWLVTGTGDALVDGEAYSKDEGNTFEIFERGTRASGDHLDPIVFDTQTNNTTVKVTVMN